MDHHFLIVFALCLVVTRVSCQVDCGVSFNIDHWKLEIQAAKDNDQPTQKILGGDAAPVHAWPWVVSVDGLCTGSIVHENWVISAKHCSNKQGYTIYYGGNSIDTSASIHSSDSYYPAGRELQGTDILLIKLNGSIPFSNVASPICLRRHISEKTGDYDVAAGYGRFEFGGEWVEEPEHMPSKWIRESIVPIRRFQHNMCFDLHYSPKTEICAGGYNKGVTHGDSGGPLMSLIDGKWYQHGVVSRGINKAPEADPQIIESEVIYTDITAFCDWMEETTEGDVKCQ